jgi:hypothetical protein
MKLKITHQSPEANAFNNIKFKQIIKMKQLSFSLICMILFFVSCNETEKMDYPTIDLVKSISVANGNMKSINDISSEYRLIPLATNDSCLLSSFRINEILDDDIWIQDNSIIYRFDKKSGNFLFKLNRKVPGSEEYLSISNFTVDPISKILFIYDLQKRKILMYDYKGTFIGSIENDFIGAFSVKDDYFIVNYSPFSDEPFHIGIYDKDWNIINQFIPKNMEVKNQKGIIYFDMFMKFNNQYYTKPSFIDTIYKIDKESIKPYLIVSTGNLKPPFEIATSLNRENKQKLQQYISQESGMIISNYYFSQYYYQMKMYQDIWDLSTLSLIYRNLRTSPESKNGFPFILKEGKTIYVEIKFVSGNCLYGSIPIEELKDIIPDIKDDDNPFIIEIKID